MIYKSMVRIPLTISSETHAFIGPLLGPNFIVEKFKAFFPVYHRAKPIVCKVKIAAKDSTKVDPNVND